MGLAATTVASSFGKVILNSWNSFSLIIWKFTIPKLYDIVQIQLVHPSRRASAMETPQHLAKAALLMITNNIGSLAKLHAQATGVENVLFTGSFMHRNKVIVHY